MANSKHTATILDLKNTLAVLGASIGVAMSPVAAAADASTAVNGDGVKVQAGRKAGGDPKMGDGSVRGANGELLPAITPAGSSQHKLAPQGAGQYKENSPNFGAPAGASQLKIKSGKSAPLGADQHKSSSLNFTTPAGAIQQKAVVGKTTPQGAQQLKIEAKATSQTGQ